MEAVPPRRGGRSRKMAAIDGERLYLDLFAKGEYCPELLLDECAIAQAAAASPEAQWKLANLKKMKR